jgi:group I intron endonuclease
LYICLSIVALLILKKIINQTPVGTQLRKGLIFFVMIGIYKITNPKNRIYIGQSVNINSRFYSYKSLKCKSQPKIYKSLLKYGIENHKFEIILECEENQLNDLERYWQELYNSVENGLNCLYTKTNDRSGKSSEETKLKISLNNTRPFLGKKHTEESKIKMSNSMKGKQSRLGAKLSEETKLKISNSHKGKKLSKETKLKMSILRKGKKIPNQKNRVRKVLDTNTNIIYNSIKECAECNGINKVTLGGYLRGLRKNITSFVYY